MARNPKATNFVKIVEAVRQRLIDENVFTDSTIFPALNRDQALTFQPPSTTYAAVVPGGFASDPGRAAGGGRDGLEFDWLIYVLVITKVSLDPGGGRSAQTLTHDTLGALVKLFSVIDKLEQYDPTDSGREILDEPMRLLNSPETRKGDAEFGIFETRWEVKFKPDLAVR